MGAIVATTTTFAYVEEKEAFLTLFPHRYDFIYAPHPEPKAKPRWHSEKRYPLSDRQLLKGEYLYGVRFEQETQYFLLDIDSRSPYHPQNAPLALDRIFDTLEPLGITDRITCTSSDSQGLHVYFPIAKAFNSWKLAKAISIALENAGFKLKLGQLELFPNPKTYSTSETPSLFSAHRLPLQMGSYVLDDGLQPINGSHITFVRMWKFCQRRNKINTRRLRTLLKKAKQISYQLSNKASKFLSDLDTEIEAGWTDRGQTNRLLGRITMRSFIFSHIIKGGKPLEGKTLVEEIISTAKKLPGYEDWCQHQHEIEERAVEWGRCIENSRYFAYGSAKGKYKELSSDNQVDNELGYNQRQAKATQEKIASAMQDLQDKGVLPEKVTARFKSLLAYGIGGASLYRYRELWHPIELKREPKNDFIESGLHNTDFEGTSTDGANALKNPTSLLPSGDSNSPKDKALSSRPQPSDEKPGSNLDNSAQAVRDRIRQQLADAQKARLLAQQAPAAQPSEGTISIHRQALRRMQEFLLSGEPILLAEVGQWLAKQPQVVHEELTRDGDAAARLLLQDLAAVALHLQQQRRSPWEVRFELEEHFEKSTILELTVEERQGWVRSLRQWQQSEDSS